MEVQKTKKVPLNYFKKRKQKAIIKEVFEILGMVTITYLFMFISSLICYCLN